MRWSIAPPFLYIGWCRLAPRSFFHGTTTASGRDRRQIAACRSRTRASVARQLASAEPSLGTSQGGGVGALERVASIGARNARPARHVGSPARVARRHESTQTKRIGFGFDFGRKIATARNYSHSHPRRRSGVRAGLTAPSATDDSGRFKKGN